MLPDLKIDGKKRAPALITTALADPEPRAETATELGKLGVDAEDAIPALTKLKLDPDKEVREAASNAIELIKQ